MKLKEKKFDNGLIVQYRKSAVLFLVEYDKNKISEYMPAKHIDGRWVKVSTGEYYIDRSQTDRRFCFNINSITDLLFYLRDASNYAWKDFSPKVADCQRADYDSYWDNDNGDEGTLSINGRLEIITRAPYQKSGGRYARLYKFDKRKMESFIYDLEKILE